MIETDNRILHEYDKQKSLYMDFLDYFKNTITGIVNNESIVLQGIDCRCKTRDSLKKKIQSKQKYKSIHDITDICGMRIITYFSDDVDTIANIFREEFQIDENNSIDKRDNDDPTKFGYVSLHYVVSLKNNRTDLLEAKRFKDLKIEIQIRTILQHAWAEIEHDLGYKSEKDIPKKIKRQFSRLASHIELADEEFVRIKEHINSYRAEVKDSIENYHIDEVLIDMVSLHEFLNTDKEYRDIVQSYESFLPGSIDYNSDIGIYNNIMSNIIKICNKLKIKTIKELKNLYLSYSKDQEICLRARVDSYHVHSIALVTPLISVLLILNHAKNKIISSEKFMEINEYLTYQEYEKSL